MRPRIDPGQLTASAMVCGILFGWGVLYLTRDETRDNLDNLNERLAHLDGVGERLDDVERVLNPQLTALQNDRWLKKRRAQQVADETDEDVIYEHGTMGTKVLYRRGDDPEEGGSRG